MEVKPGRYDLHMHTHCSDGTDSVSEVVHHVTERGLAGFSITDHDTVAAQAEAAALAAAADIPYVSGIELSVSSKDRDLHVLVYGYDLKHAEFLKMLEVFRESRRERAIHMAQKLAELGVPIDIDEILKSVPSGAVGRPHLARALIENRAVSGIREAFDKYLGADAPAYLPKYQISPNEGMDLAKRAGGVPVLAHPGSYPFEVDLAELVDAGLMGLETSYPSWDAKTTSFWRAQAKRFDLLETGGSDYHGGNRSRITVGAATISAEMFERLLTAQP